MPPTSRAVTLVVLALLAPAVAGCLDDAPTLYPHEGAGPVGGFSGTSVFEGDYGTDDVPGPLTEGPYEALPGEVVDVPSAIDGAPIHIAFVRPDVPDGERVPVIVIASPYLPPIVADDDARPLAFTASALATGLGGWFLPHGYAMAAVAVRGTAGSGGCMEYMGPNEQADVDQAVTWLATQSWSSGNVGMIGLSYDGSTPWMVAAKGNPHLKTIVPLSGVNDVFDLHFHGGTPQERGVWHPLAYWGIEGVSSSALAGSAEGLTGNAACTTVAEAKAAAAQVLLTAERNPYYDVRNFRPGVEANYRGSVFLVQGLQDWNVVPGHQYPWINQLEDQGIVVKHFLGQWEHEFPDEARLDFAEVLLHWWDYWLKEDTTVDLGPRVQVQDSEGRWRDEADWPPQDATALRFHLTPDGLSATVSDDEEAVLVTVNPRHLVPEPGAEAQDLHATCPGCVVARSEALAEDVLIAGIMTMQVDVTPLGANGYVTGYLYLEDDDGARRLGWGSVDLRYAHGGPEPQAVTPGERLPLTLRFEPVDAVATAGASLVLVITQGSYGPDRPTAWELPATAMQPLQVHVGGPDAWLDLPTVTRGPDAYFEAP